MNNKPEEEKEVATTGQNISSDSSDRKSLKISAALVVLLAGILAFVTLNEPEPVRKPKPLPKPLVVPGSVRESVPKTTQQRSNPIEQTETVRVNDAPKSAPIKRPKHLEGTVQALREDLLDVAPGVYTGVRLAMEEDIEIKEGQKIDEIMKRLNVSYVEITASAGSWDHLKSDAKVDLLYGTFTLLKKQYPALSQYVRVVFDDDRKSLDLKFDDFRDVIEAG